jgi:hypothetical protein
MATKQKPRFTLEIETPANGRLGKSTVVALDKDRKVIHSDQANLTDARERGKLAKRMATKLGDKTEKLLEQIERVWNQALAERRRFQEQAAAGSPEAAVLGTSQLLDAAPLTVRRPLCLIGGRAYAAAWVPLQHTLTQTVEKGVIVKHDPPLITLEDALLIVTSDGTLYADKNFQGARPLSELGLLVRLPASPPPERCWSGAGVKRYLAGERPNPAEVFGRTVQVVDSFLDFARSLAPQETMCELVACYVLSTYLLDAFHVVGYVWPNGERGTGKTSLLQVVVELAYLGQLILAGSSYACLRDLADYGATLAFDDAEAVMDTRRTDPDKRTLLLAGNRRGATVAVKELEGERWVTRHLNTFCPRLFSAIRLPDEVLGSRSIIVPLVRSGDPQRAKANCLDPEDWPCDRRRLVDDLWALGLTHLAELPGHDREAAAAANLAGRNLDPWRPILAVAHWFQNRHGVTGIYDRMEKLSQDYQGERSDYEDSDRTRVMFRALLELARDCNPRDPIRIIPSEIAQRMNDIAKGEELAEPGKDFTTPRKVGWLLKRQRFKRSEDRTAKNRPWLATCAEIHVSAKAYGVDIEEEVPF